MLNPPLEITGIGLVSGLGDAHSACAAARAGITRPVRLSFSIEDRAALEMVPVVGRTAGDATLGFSEVGLAVRLASLALADLLSRTSLDADDLRRSAVLVNLPSSYHLRKADEIERAAAPPKGPSALEEFEATEPLYESVIDKSFRAIGLVGPPPERQRVYFGDHAGIATVLVAAHRLLAEGTVSMCLVGGIDSLAEPRWLRALATLGLLKTTLCPVGLIPGEAAAFLLLETQKKRGRERPSLGTIVACELGREQGDRFSDPPPVGRTLTSVIRESLASEVTGPLAFVSDLNGDAPRATEYGHALIGLNRDIVPVMTFLPAIAFGDTRAAAGFLGACVALRALARGYSPGTSLVISAMSDDGARAAIRLNAAT